MVKRDGKDKEGLSAANTGVAMTSSAYILLEATEGRAEDLARRLAGRPGVRAVHRVEGPPDVVVLTEAEGRTSLAELTVDALMSVEDLTVRVDCLPVCGMEGWQAERDKEAAVV